MEGGVRSGVLQGSVVKSKSGMGASRSFQSGKEKKRRGMVSSDLESSVELEESCVRKGADRESGSSSRRDRFDQDECRKGEDDWLGKKRKLDVFEFDEYDRFDENLRTKKDCGIDWEDSEDKGNIFASPSDAMRMDSEAATSEGGGVIVYKRRSSFKVGSTRLTSVRNKFANQSMNRNVDSLFSSKSSNASVESLRVQGKNGVLKMQVNKSKGSNLHKTHSSLDAEDYKTPKDGTTDQAGSVGRTGKAFLNLHKSMSTKSSHMQDSGTDDSDTSSKSGRILDSRKAVSRKQCKGKITTPDKSIPPVFRSRYERSKHRGGTEKQKLREHIKQMLLDAGWTIDYRPRKNRSYNDAVYINTSGTSYWSIIKAYDALQKEAAYKNEIISPVGESSFSPLPETILCKLTRTTRQKVEKEKKIKRHENGRSGRLKQASARRSSKANSESEETTSDEDQEEDYDEEEEEELNLLDKKCSKSLKAENDLNRNSGSQYLDQFSHDEDLVSHGKKKHLQPQARKNKKLGRCTLLVRSANKGMNPNDGYVPYTGKRTLLSWLIDCGTVELSEKIRFMNRTRKRTLQQGWITRDGIHCVCCNKIVTIAKFEVHAGTKLWQPFQNIITENGDTLLQCMLEAWNQQAQSLPNYFHNVDVDGDDPNDDTCTICGDGGDLICCDGCPSTFHQNCLGIEVLPAGDWHCPQCICIHCSVSDESEIGGDTSKCSLQTCSLCEKKYHFSCLKEVDSCAVDSNGYPFCGAECEELHRILQKSIGVRNELEEGFSWSLIRRTIVDSNDSINETPLKVECNAKLAVAQTIMDECFLPIVDRRSQVNLIHNVLYNCGSNFNRLNYKGFYTAILEKGDEIISAASLRFHGTQFAEMPFIGTRHIYRRQGMCRRLFSAIESALCLFKVEKLIIPAISELLHTWTKVFGFHHLEQSDKEKLRSFNLLVFPGIDMLQKVLIEKNKLEDEAVVETGLYSTNEATPDLMCQDPGVLMNDSSAPNSPLDDQHACSEPRNGVTEHMNESCFPIELEKVCVDDGIVTNKQASAPDSIGTQDFPSIKEVLHVEDRNTASELNSEETKAKSESEMKCHYATDCNNADANMNVELVSESVVGKDVQSVEDADNHNLPGSDITDPVSLGGCVESYRSTDDCDVPTGCDDKVISSRPCSEQCTPPHPDEAKKALAEEVISNTPTHQAMGPEENSGDLAACATEFNTLQLHTLNGEIIMDDAEIQRTSCDNPTSKEKYFSSHLTSDAAAVESVLYPTLTEKDSHKVTSPISITYTTVARIAPDEDVDMISLLDTDTSTYTTSNMINVGQTFSNGSAVEKGTESLVTLKIISDAAEQAVICSATDSMAAE
ncbi:unnamed protein product [Rhodiola kirilowii]